MSWFGETFGDSLTSLKGQFSKMAKEVLADDESSDLKKESDNSTIKELQALCEAKDLEILSLRDEFAKLQSHYKSQRESIGNENPDSSSTNTELQNSPLTQLQSEISQLKKEKNYLNQCLDELQFEHEINLQEMVSIRDKYKEELEELKEEHAIVKIQLEKQSTNQHEDSKSQDLIALQARDDKIKCLLNEIESLQSSLEKVSRENVEHKSALDVELENSAKYKKEIEKLTEKAKILTEEKSKTEENSRNILLNNENLLRDLELMKKKNYELEEQLINLSKENGILMEKLKESNQPDLNSISRTDVEINSLKILKIIQAENHDKFKGLDDDPFKTIETCLSEFRKNSEEKNEKLKIIIDEHSLEIKQLKEENVHLQNTIKEEKSNWFIKEKKYQDDLLIAQQQLEESTDLKLKFLDLEKQSQLHSQSQTDDVKRLEQEVSKLQQFCDIKTDEIAKLVKLKNHLEQELVGFKTESDNTIEKLASEIKGLQENIEAMQNKEILLNNARLEAEEKCSNLLSENISLSQINGKLTCDIDCIKKELADAIARIKTKEDEFDEAQNAIAELQKSCVNLQSSNTALNCDLENLKAQIIIRENNLKELIKSNSSFQEENSKLQTRIGELIKCEEELQKWKNISVDLEIQVQDLSAKIEGWERENSKPCNDQTSIDVKESEIIRLKQENISLSESCNRLNQELEKKIQEEQFSAAKEADLNGKLQSQGQIIGDLQEENAELKSRIQKFQEQMKIQILQNEELSKGAVLHHHRRSKSDFDSSENAKKKCLKERNEDYPLGGTPASVKQTATVDKSIYDDLLVQFQEATDRESSARKELERLRQHLIEIEDHYTEEALENEKVINELKSKLMVAEEQLSNSSTLYTSAKIRDNQHVESLQNQLRLLGAQRDDFQAKLSEAEDEIQKHRASLTSLQIVLEQFQQDRERDMEAATARHQKHMESVKMSFIDLEREAEDLKRQLNEAKHGLQAASRLGEQLEKKTQQALESEKLLQESKDKIVQLEAQLEVSNQSVTGKIDKSLIKNLVMGYILTPKADRKAQVLRILASVLDFDQEERSKMGVDASASGWLTSIFHPKGENSSANESLSEAFIKFLESESRPQPQLNLLPEQLKTVKPKASTSAGKPQGTFTELVLPTFSSLKESESSIILKNVLKDS